MATKEDVQYALEAMMADPEARADLTDRARPGNALRLREFNELNRQLAEHDGVRAASSAKELDDAVMRERLGDAEYAAVQKALAEAGLV